MLSLKISDQNVDLSDDFSITMNLKSPMFGDVGSYSYPFKLPNTPRNASVLGFRHRVENTTDIYREDKGMFLWNRINLFQGTVTLKTLNSKLFEGSILEGQGDFNYQRKKLLLQDINFGEALWFVNTEEKMAYINACKNTVYPDRAISFPMIHNKTYFEEPPTDYMLEYFNYYDQSTIYEINPVTTTTMVIVPMLYVRYVLKKIFEHLGFVFDDIFFTSSSDFNKLVLYNSVDCNSGVVTPNYFQYPHSAIGYNFHVPRVSLSDFFTGLESFFNIRFFVNYPTRTVKLISLDTIVKATDFIDLSTNIISVSTEPEEKKTGYHLSMSMDTDDETFTAFKEIQEKFMERIKTPVQSVAELMAWPLSDYEDIRWVYDEGCYYNLPLTNVWVALTESYFDDFLYYESIYKNKNESIETKFSALMNESTAPFHAVVGNAMTNWKKSTPKLLFTRYVDNGYYDRKMVGEHNTGVNNLFYYGTYGLLNKHYKAFFDFCMATKLVKIVKQMSFQELKEFDFSKKYMIGGTLYLVKSIQVTLKKDRIMPATLECFTCP